MFPSNAAIVTAAGTSTRFNAEIITQQNVKKEFIKFSDGKTVLYKACEPFFSVPNFKVLVVTYHEGKKEQTIEALSDLYKKNIPLCLVTGGKTRRESVFNALKELISKYPEIEIVSIHDGDRPFVDINTVLECISKASVIGGAVPALKIFDTLTQADENLFYGKNIDRKNLYAVQTPQCFKLKNIYLAHSELLYKTSDSLESACFDNDLYTDDASIYRASGFDTALIPGSEKNKKITCFSDLPEELKNSVIENFS